MGYPKMDGLEWKLPLKWMIWGYPQFRKPPFIINCKQFTATSLSMMLGKGNYPTMTLFPLGDFNNSMVQHL